MIRKGNVALSLFALAAMSAGCASDARVAADERRIVELQRHVIALEALLDDDDDVVDPADDVKLVYDPRDTDTPLSPPPAVSP